MIDRVPVVLQGISWSRDHGHPLLLLRALEVDICFAVVADADEARALSTCSCMPDRTRRHLARLLVDLLRTLGASIIDIELHQGEQRVLRAVLRIASPRGVHRFDIPGSDGLLLASETGVVPVMALEEILAIDRRSHGQGLPNEARFSLPPYVLELLAELEQFGSLDDHSDVSE
ncbi:DUF151 domain-containing protein [Thermomicrobium sp. 4228-Ro]|uniref:bifunctional nuclease domain-containing protein n=1 Tax=Thermomicrobium sp. 4228-Ro TaxID=2993937 RepID=UPI002248DAC9|nr:bifunctional nuclease domain-containing protein [Thermomicrobium sp. 4228-Ro]MCX2727903.1 DUF151 domain-containing protein [Thermomicrobium sp. 4228-Ro]